MTPQGIVQGCLVLCMVGLVFSMFDFTNRIEIFLGSWLGLVLFSIIWGILWLISYFLNRRKRRVDSRHS